MRGEIITFDDVEENVKLLILHNCIEDKFPNEKFKKNCKVVNCGKEDPPSYVGEEFTKKKKKI